VTPPDERIPWFQPQVGAAEEKRLAEVLESGYINAGEVTREFEERVAETIGARHCIAVSSGTAAIALALMGKGIGPGDEVIVPDLTFIATANAVRLTGANVKLVDVETKRFTLDVERTRAAIGPRTRAVVPVDVNGRGADYGVLETLCRDKGLALICDSAEALGSKCTGRFLGTFGDAGAFSFSAAKTISSGQGGMIATDDEDLTYRLRELRDQGRRSQGTGGNDLHPVVGFNFKYTNLQAAVALCQMDRLADRLDHFRRRDQWYRDLLTDCPGVSLPPLDDGEEVRQWTDILTDRRDDVVAALSDQGIGCRPFWYPLHTQAPDKASDNGFPGAMAVSYQGLWLPSSFELTREEAALTAGIIRQTLSGTTT
jgi:perosamine synthetase